MSQRSTPQSGLFTEKYWTHRPDYTGYSPESISELSERSPNHLQCRLFHIRHGNVGHKQRTVPHPTFSSPALSSGSSSSSSVATTRSGSERPYSGRVDYTQSRLFQIRFGKPTSRNMDGLASSSPANVRPKLVMEVHSTYSTNGGRTIAETKLVPPLSRAIPIAKQVPTSVNTFIQHPRPFRISRPQWVDEFFMSEEDVRSAEPSSASLDQYLGSCQLASSPWEFNPLENESDVEEDEEATLEEDEPADLAPYDWEERIWRFDLFGESNEFEEEYQWPPSPSVCQTPAFKFDPFDDDD